MSLLNRLKNAWGAATRREPESLNSAELGSMIGQALQAPARQACEKPRRHHYNFAYKALPGLAFADPHVPLAFASVTYSWNDLQESMASGDPTEREAPNRKLADFWDYAGAKLPHDERLSSSGLAAIGGEFGPDNFFVLVRMPKPVRLTEPYFVAILYPRQWLEHPQAYESLTPTLRCYLLAKSNVPGSGGVSGATLRIIDRGGHGAVSSGVTPTARAFLEKVQAALRNPNRCLTWVDSPTWSLIMQDREAEQSYGPA